MSLIHRGAVLLALGAALCTAGCGQSPAASAPPTSTTTTVLVPTVVTSASVRTVQVSTTSTVVSTTTVTETATPVTAPAPAPATIPAAGSAPEPAVEPSVEAAAVAPEIQPPARALVNVPAPTVTFANCTEARAAGAAPVRRGDPGYSSKLDRDGDGVGCE